MLRAEVIDFRGSYYDPRGNLPHFPWPFFLSNLPNQLAVYRAYLNSLLIGMVEFLVFAKITSISDKSPIKIRFSYKNSLFVSFLMVFYLCNEMCLTAEISSDMLKYRKLGN